MQVLQYIKENGIQKLNEEFGIMVKLYDEGLYVLNYDQINSPKANPIVVECRGLIIDHDFNIVSRSLEDAYKRDSLRANGVGQNVIYSQYQKWLEYKGRKTYVADESKPKAILFDIDGTLAQMEGRSPFAWGKVSTDSVKELIKAMAVGYDAQDYLVICVSGRDGVCYDDTKSWLNINRIPFWYLFMREEGDTRKDTIIKEEIFWNDIAEHYNVVGVVDDRPSVVRMWHELKIPNVICVGNPWVEF